MPSETRWMRDDRHTINGLTSYKLGIAQGSVALFGKQLVDPDMMSSSYSAGIRVWKRSSSGVETEITFGTPVAVVTRTVEGTGMQSATWLCPLTSLINTDAILVRIYHKFDIDASWTLELESLSNNPAEFITEQLGASQLDSVTWTVYYWTEYRYVPGAGNIGQVKWSGTSFLTRIINFSWSTGAPPPSLGQILGDGLTFMVS